MSNRKRPDEQGTLPDGWVTVGLDDYRIPARRYENMTVFVIGGGWTVFRVHDRPGLPVPCLYVRQHDDRRPDPWWYLDEIRYRTGGPYRMATDWSEFPIAQLDRLATTTDFFELLEATRDSPPGELLDRATEVGRLALRALLPNHWLEALPALYAASDPRDRGVSFYIHVARAYEEILARGGQPGPEIAARLGVPSTTVHRWLREARALGYLAPARRDEPSKPGRTYIR